MLKEGCILRNTNNLHTQVYIIYVCTCAQSEVVIRDKLGLRERESSGESCNEVIYERRIGWGKYTRLGKVGGRSERKSSN